VTLRTNWLDRAVLAVSPRAGAARLRARAIAEVIQATAGYDAAGKGRGNEWVRRSGTSQNAEGRKALTALRNAHRELARNNAYASAAIDVVVSRTVGEGIQPVARNADPEKQRLAQELMDEWAATTLCDVDGQLNFFGLQGLVMRTETESGEALVMHRIRRMRDVRVPLQLRVLEGDYLDHLRDGTINTKRVVQGVVYGADNDREGYYLFRDHPGDPTVGGQTSVVTGAENVAHVFDVRRPGQARGIPRAAAAMMRLQNLDDFQDARLWQQKIAACMAAFVTQGEEGKVKGDPLPDKMEPGLLVRLGQDEQVSTVTPPPVSGQQEFIQGEEHMIAKAYGITHQALTGYLQGANFASSKIGRLDMYSNIGRWRTQMLYPQCLRRVAHWFVEAAYLGGHDITGTTFDWVPPRSEILNLRDEIPALIKQARGGFGSLFSILRSLGYPDPKALLLEIKDVNEFLDEHGIVLDTDPRKTTNSGQMQSAASGEPGADPEPEPEPAPPAPGEPEEN
jgi:lambda family phage portal protein